MIRAVESKIRAGQNFSCRLILQLILKYKNIIKTNLNLKVFIQEIKDRDYVIDPAKYKSMVTLWIASQVNGDNVTYFENFGVEYIPKEIKNAQATKTLKQIFTGRG